MPNSLIAIVFLLKYYVTHSWGNGDRQKMLGRKDIFNYLTGISLGQMGVTGLRLCMYIRVRVVRPPGPGKQIPHDQRTAEEMSCVSD